MTGDTTPPVLFLPFHSLCVLVGVRISRSMLFIFSVATPAPLDNVDGTPVPAFSTTKILDWILSPILLLADPTSSLPTHCNCRAGGVPSALLGCHADTLASSALRCVQCMQGEAQLVTNWAFREINGANSGFTRPMPASWVAGSHVRVLPRPQRLHLPRPREWSRVSDRSRLRIGCPCPGERGHARFHGLPELFRQWGYAGQEWDRPGPPGRRNQPQAPEGSSHVVVQSWTQP